MPMKSLRDRLYIAERESGAIEMRIYDNLPYPERMKHHEVPDGIEEEVGAEALNGIIRQALRREIER